MVIKPNPSGPGARRYFGQNVYKDAEILSRLADPPSSWAPPGGVGGAGVTVVWNGGNGNMVNVVCPEEG